MSRDIMYIKEYTPYGTIYDNFDNRFRVIEVSEGVFRIQLIVDTSYIKGFLWWKKTIHKREFKDLHLKIFPTIEAAEEWIKDCYRYPIIHLTKTK